MKRKVKKKKVRFTNLIWQHGFLDKNFYNALKNKKNTEKQNTENK
jgi:hypothetical protein